MFNWLRYNHCPRCGAEPGKKCFDLRYATRTGTFFANTPHKNRPTLPPTATFEIES